MTATQSLKIYDVLVRQFKSDEDARIVIQEIEDIVSEKFLGEKNGLSTKSEAELLRKDMETIRIELAGKIESSALRVENNLKSEINKLIVWIIGTMLASGALFITLAKIFFDK